MTYADVNDLMADGVFKPDTLIEDSINFLCFGIAIILLSQMI